ncbi:MAG: hypothetical protein MZW92_50030 [Comamonadaceae bacterium]|nr:hypothetical protein [Comamonadaceae bacterium]
MVRLQEFRDGTDGDGNGEGKERRSPCTGARPPCREQVAHEQGHEAEQRHMAGVEQRLPHHRPLGGVAHGQRQEQQQDQSDVNHGKVEQGRQVQDRVARDLAGVALLQSAGCPPAYLATRRTGAAGV